MSELGNKPNDNEDNEDNEDNFRLEFESHL